MKRSRGPVNIKPHERHGNAIKGNWSAEYSVWAGMVRRCENPNEATFPRYGGRGIRVCRRWRMSFRAFLSDMGRRPLGRWLDRIDSNGDYVPSNCRWATIREQMQNKTNNRRITFRGRTLCLAEWARVKGMSMKNLHHRLARGWSVSRALTQPLGVRVG